VDIKGSTGKFKARNSAVPRKPAGARQYLSGAGVSNSQTTIKEFLKQV
jgi:hypothetical protein